MLRKFAIELLNEVAEECDQRSLSVNESEQKRALLENIADKITVLVETLAVESD